MTDPRIVEGILQTDPLLLLAIKDKQVIEQLNNLIPYSTAFEIECDQAPDYKELNFSLSSRFLIKILIAVPFASSVSTPMATLKL